MSETELQLEPQSDGSASGAILERALAGEVLSILFTSDSKEFAVLRLRDKAGSEHVLVGPMADAYEGQDIEAHGRWEEHKQYGKRFRVSHYRGLMPSTEEGIRRYLASGVVPGIGPKLADRIVDHFGADTLKVIEHYSARLTEVPGFGKRRLQDIREAWTDQADKRDVFIFLQGIGITPAYCERIYRRYGPQCPDVVRGNPYRLANEIRGIGFKMADAVAARLEIERDNPFRLGCGVAYALKRLADQQGHTCYPADRLVESASHLLEVPTEVAGEGLRRALADGVAVADDEGRQDDPHWIYPADLYWAEQGMARKLQTMLAQPPPPAPAEGPPVSNQWHKFNEARQRAVAAAFESPVSIITGGPGVGKTTVTREVVHWGRQLGLTLALAAPTGRAAKRLSESSRAKAKTIHRLLRWEPDKQAFYHNENNPLPADLLIIDEVSMLDMMLGWQLFRALQPTTRVVLVGDHDQLPSVGPGSVLRELIHCEQLSVTNLTEVYRQEANSRIIHSAHAVNSGAMPDIDDRPGPNELRDFYWIDQDDADKAVDIIARMVGERIPERFEFSALDDIQVLAPMNRGVCGAVNLNQRLQQTLNPPGVAAGNEFKHGETVFRVGDRVMQVVNNYDHHIFNGDPGRIHAVYQSDRRFTVLFDSGSVDYSFEEADQLRLAYAITIHKSQGSEFPVVIVPLLTQHYMMLRRNLLYTAMTRAERLLILVGSRQAMAMAVRNVNEAPRYSRLGWRLRHTAL